MRLYRVDMFQKRCMSSTGPGNGHVSARFACGTTARQQPGSDSVECGNATEIELDPPLLAGCKCLVDQSVELCCMMSRPRARQAGNDATVALRNLNLWLALLHHSLKRI